MDLEQKILGHISELMANWTKASDEGEQQKSEEVKSILDCAAYPSFTNKLRQTDITLTHKIRNDLANGKFQPSHRTKIKVETGTRKV